MSAVRDTADFEGFFSCISGVCYTAEAKSVVSQTQLMPNKQYIVAEGRVKSEIIAGDDSLYGLKT
jgi:hypothetical protein